MNTEQIRKYFDLRQKDISKIFDVPLRTVQNWDNRNSLPRWIADMMWFVLDRCQVERDLLNDDDQDERARKIRELYESQ